MAEVLERSSPEWSRECSCSKCDTRTRYSQDDLERDGFRVSGYFFDGSAKCESRYFLTCPVCKRHEFVPDDDVPEIVRIYVRESGRDGA